MTDRDKAPAVADPMASLLGLGAGGNKVAQFIAAPRRAVWTLALPVMAGMAIQTLYNLTDMFFVGRLGGDAVAALTFNMPIVFFAVGITFGLGTGATSVIARCIGSGDKKAADNAAEHALLVGTGIGVVIVALALAFKVALFDVLGAEGEVLSLATRYFEITAPGFVFNILNTTFRAILAGEGDTRTPLAFQGGGTLLNAALDPLFIFTFGMGVPGAAWATVLSQGLVLVAFAVYIFVRKGTFVEFRFGDFRPSARIAADILRVGLPSSASMVIMSTGGMFFNRIVSAFGSQAVAGLGVGGRMDSIYFLPTFALASSQVTLAAMFLGARRVDLIRQTLNYTILWGEVMAVGFAVGGWLFAPQISRAFTADPVIVDISSTYIRTIAFGFPFITIGVISGRVFQGLGNGMPGLLLTSLRILLISVPVAWIFTRVLGYGLQSVWVAFVLSGMITSVVAATWIRRRLREVEAGITAGVATPAVGAPALRPAVGDAAGSA